jgi:hypothetical protein
MIEPFIYGSQPGQFVRLNVEQLHTLLFSDSDEALHALAERAHKANPNVKQREFIRSLQERAKSAPRLSTELRLSCLLILTLIKRMLRIAPSNSLRARWLTSWPMTHAGLKSSLCFGEWLKASLRTRLQTSCALQSGVHPLRLARFER